MKLNDPVDRSADSRHDGAVGVQDERTPQEISTEVLLEKYAKGTESTADEVRRRVASALACERCSACGRIGTCG